MQSDDIKPTGAQTSTFNTRAINVGSFKEATIIQRVGTVSGTSPSLTTKLQVSSDGSNWVDHGNAFTAVTSSNNDQVMKIAANLGAYIRLVGTITGTSPSFTINELSVVTKR